jgi:AcrR family transcriptional regulator
MQTKAVHSGYKCMTSKLIDTYIEYTLTHQKGPSSVYEFAKLANMAENEFYNHYASLEALEMDIFRQWFIQTRDAVTQTEVYAHYSTREKMLAFFFGWIEKLKQQRSFVKFMFERKSRHLQVPQFPVFLKSMRESYLEYARHMVNEAIDKNEITERKYISDKYDEALWANLLFVMGFWLKDSSNAFEKTDEAIERSVNLAFDLMGRSPLDSMIEFGKFLFQNR